MGPRSLAVVLVAGASLTACGGSAEVGATYSSNAGGAGGVSGAGGAGGFGGAASSSAQTSATSSSSAQSSSSSAATSSSAASSTASSGGMTGACDAPDTCATAEQLSDIDGDQNDDIRTISGTKSQWFKVRVDDHMPTFGNDNESYTATLTSPPGIGFDLYVYTGDGSTPDCFGTPVQGTGSPETASDAWPDGTSDDSRWITFEVRHVSGLTCDPSAKWTLEVEGHTGG